MAEIKTTKELKRENANLNPHIKDPSDDYCKGFFDAIRQSHEKINSFEVGLKNKTIGIQEAFEEVLEERPELQVSLYDALIQQGELLLRILGIKSQPIRSIEELRSLLEGGEGKKG